MSGMLPSALVLYLFNWLSAFSSLNNLSNPQQETNELTFHLRHFHAHVGARVLFADVFPGLLVKGSTTSENAFTIKTRRRTTHKPRSHLDFLEARRRSMIHKENVPVLWNVEEVEAPDVEHRDSLLTIAKMTYDAYLEPTDKDWYDLGENWTDNHPFGWEPDADGFRGYVFALAQGVACNNHAVKNHPFGWEPDADGFRGYVFATEDNSTVVLSIKGTSASFLGGGGPTAKKDKLNGAQASLVFRRHLLNPNGLFSPDNKIICYLAAAARTLTGHGRKYATVIVVAGTAISIAYKMLLLRRVSSIRSTEDNSTVVLSIKGTSASFLGGGGPTAKKDKLNGAQAFLVFRRRLLNPNGLFSPPDNKIICYLAAAAHTSTGHGRKYATVIVVAGIAISIAYKMLLLRRVSSIRSNLYYNLTYLYPNSNIWITGHSLGGALASLLGVTFGAPAVTFESPGEKMASERLHLPQPPSTQHITHIYHTADPIAMGTCTGILSSCAIAGYALESRCHLGESIVYDTISNLSWASDVRTHTIKTVIERLLSVPWAPAIEQGREVPKPQREEDCIDCFKWEFQEPTNMTN
ncbi:alpha/beta-hydrolase [Sanghuangporus baumii]|uniref:triacylglycerol lipase n=1 Tax=Sanghuangporus baumii TaxID=108892 RepID=A0A9Q5I2K6_SANBA|nr:alpha/beta-hydrolase [Sanghuangporus baumii]